MDIALSRFLGPEVRILAVHKAGLIALEKPAGLLSHPNKDSKSPRSLLSLPYSTKEEAYFHEGQFFYLLHRLDSPTSGVLLLASSTIMAQYIRKAFEVGNIHKTYHALVHRQPSQNPKIWVDSLNTVRMGQQLRTQKTKEKGLLSKTLQVLIKRNQALDISLLKLNPLTGRTHQLRVQCATHGAPIVGDKTYGDFSKNRSFERFGGSKRLFLHASKIELKLPNQEPFEVSSALPEAFKIALCLKNKIKGQSL